MRSRSYHHGDLPATLLARAEKTVRERGVHALSLRELARDIGVSPAAPNRHFTSKQDLLDAVALRGFQRLARAVEQACADAGETFPERLGAVARAYLGFAAANGTLLDLMFDDRRGPERPPRLHEAARNWYDQVVMLVADGQNTGEVRQGAPDRVALPVLAALRGCARLQSDGALPGELIEHGVDDLVTAVVRGCAP
ncbi:TetR/AcrR family transcriptional regulator [Streptomyces sp. KHY 26]|uniref:TetR/AcrR family transcriptional regulator n=1 Tax=Streptomyces sp. KHY 26 TaxID=3097359 RepID=UPI00376EE0A9